MHLTEAALAAEPGHAGAVELLLAALRTPLSASGNDLERAFLRHAIQHSEAARADGVARQARR